LVVRTDSPLYNLLNGRLRANFVALFYTFSTVPIVAWQYVNPSGTLLVILVVTIIFSALFFFTWHNHLTKYFNEPFASQFAVNTSTWISALLSFALLWYYVWDINKIDGEFRLANLSQAMEIGISQMPNPDGLLAPILMLPFVFEALELWVVVQSKSYYLILLLSFKFALVGFFVSKLSILTSYFVDKIVWEKFDE